MTRNRLRSIETRQVDGPHGVASAIMIAVDVPEPDSAGKLVGEVVYGFKHQRICSPPDTEMMVITVTGPLSAVGFRDLWRAASKDDTVVGAFMSRMTTADVMQGSPEGQPLSRASLLG
jgi:hypothetical protein